MNVPISHALPGRPVRRTQTHLSCAGMVNVFPTNISVKMKRRDVPSMTSTVFKHTLWDAFKHIPIILQVRSRVTMIALYLSVLQSIQLSVQMDYVSWIQPVVLSTHLPWMTSLNAGNILMISYPVLARLIGLYLVGMDHVCLRRTNACLLCNAKT